MFPYVNITHSDNDPALDPSDIAAAPTAPFPIHPANDTPPNSHVPYPVQHSLDAIPLVNADPNHPHSKLDSHPIHNPVTPIFPAPDPQLPSHHRSIDHVINQPHNPLNHPPLSPHHPDHLPPHHDHDPLPHFPRSTDKPPTPLHAVSLPPPPPHQPHHRHSHPPHSQSLSHSHSHSPHSQWAIHLPATPNPPPLPTQQPPNHVPRPRPQPSDHVYYPSNPFPNHPPSHPHPQPHAQPHTQPPPPPPVSSDNYRHVTHTMRTHRTPPSAHREIDHHRSPRKRQKRSLVWQFFKESEADPNVAFCLICHQKIPRGRNLARNTTNLRKHLEHRHPEYLNGQSLSQHAKRTHPPHLSVVPSPSTLPQHHNIDDISSGMRPLFQPGSTSHRTHTDDRVLSLHPQPHHQPQPQPQIPISQPQPQPQIPISQERSALSLSPATVYHGSTHDPKSESQFRNPQSLDDSSPLVPPPNKRAASTPHPIQINQIPVSNLYNSQPQGSTQAHPPDLTDTGPNARAGKDPPPWDPKSLRPPKEFFREGDDGEEAMPNGDRQIATQEASAALVKFLAAAGLPLSTANSKQLIELLDITNAPIAFPNTVELRDHVLPNQVTLLHSKIRTALSTADVIVATIEKRDKNRLLFCHYFAQNFSLRSVCLDVIHPAEVKEAPHLGATKPPSSSENSAFQQSKAERMATENTTTTTTATTTTTTTTTKPIRKLLQRVSNNLDYWKITHKVNAVIVAEMGINADHSHFLPEPSHSASLPSLAFKDHPPPPPDTCSKSFRRPLLSSEQTNGHTFHQASDTGTFAQAKIPVLSCLINTIERIVSETICESDVIARAFIEPLSTGIFKALTDREFLSSKAFDAWSHDLRLPICNPSPWELKRLLSFYNVHMETVRHAVKRVDPKDLALQCVINRDIAFLYSLLETFAGCVRNIEPNKLAETISKRERTSSALPLIRDLLKDLENLNGHVSDPLRAIVTDVVRAVRIQANTMEKQGVYACATLLDPRFKSRYLSKDVLDNLKKNVMFACSEERRGKTEKLSDDAPHIMGTPNGSNFSGFITTTHIVEFAREQNFSSSALSSYLSEPISGYNEDIDDYWNRNRGRWPFLARVAARYIVIPCSCGSNGISNVLLGSSCRSDMDRDFSSKDIQAMSAMELLRVNAV